MVRKALITLALICGATVVGILMWGIAVFGMSKHIEDLCWDDLERRAGYGGYRLEVELWPPSYECWLGGRGVEPIVVQHPFVAWARLAIIVMVPMMYGLAVVTLAVLYWVKGPRHHRGLSGRRS